MPTELAKTYDPQAAQQRFLKFWDELGCFHSKPDPNKKPFTIVIPPPNVTGALHLGHALNNTLQDVLIRWRRMQGYEALWIPGTDHAGIATQAVVEKLVMSQEKKTRHDLGREELVKRIWQWKDRYEARILGQLKQLGASCDFDRTRFTLDPMCARAVRQTFFDLFKAGYIVRGKRLVNWDTHLQTSVADDETYTEDTKGGFWTFKYPIKPRGEVPRTPGIDPGANPQAAEFIRFSTTRPETMLGDTAVCVHPSDQRYKHLIGQKVTIPLVNREIPIIADALLADPSLGTGCVKVTPAHDANDYACYTRNPSIGIINILNPDGTINENGGKYKGLDRYKARDAVIADMEALGLFEGKEERVIPLKYSDRSKTPIEPYLSDQWFVKMDKLAQEAMDAVNQDRVMFFPSRYGRTYLDWLGERRDWCISRQLWWGHRIPVWKRTHPLDAETKARLIKTQNLSELERHESFVPSVEKLIKPFAGALSHQFQLADDTYDAFMCVQDGRPDIEDELLKAGYLQDEDVLDTWFSSALWPHSTLGWPEQTPELKYYYPTSVLVTSRDIITLWVARMVITGLFNCHEVPFHHVYIHPKILDGFGETMSKSKGNGIDPLDIIDRYGTDALRFIMVKMATETQDNRMPVGNICPHCDELVPVKQEHMYMRTRKVTCPKCKKPFRPGGPWPSEDAEFKTAKQGSERFEEGRNFANKIWNAARFILLNLDGYTPDTPTRSASEGSTTPTRSASEGSTTPTRSASEGSTTPTRSASEGSTTPTRSASEGSTTPTRSASEGLSTLPLEDRWILSRLAHTTAQVTEDLENYHFSDAARTIYDFVWSEFCDWYIEMAKGRLMAAKPQTETATLPDFSVSDPSRTIVQRVLVGVLDGIVRLVHPIMPFLAESLWQALGDAAKVRGLPKPAESVKSVAIAAWPEYPKGWHDENLEKRMARMQELVRAVREVRNHYQVDPKATLDVAVRCAPAAAADFNQLTPFIQILAGVGRLRTGADVQKPARSAGRVAAELEVYVSLEGLIDPAAEKKRIEKQIVEKTRHLQSAQAKLDNPSFRDKAPPEVVAQQQAQVADLKEQIASLEADLQELG